MPVYRTHRNLHPNNRTHFTHAHRNLSKGKELTWAWAKLEPLFFIRNATKDAATTVLNEMEKMFEDIFILAGIWMMKKSENKNILFVWVMWWCRKDINLNLCSTIYDVEFTIKTSRLQGSGEIGKLRLQVPAFDIYIYAYIYRKLCVPISIVLS